MILLQDNNTERPRLKSSLDIPPLVDAFRSKRILRGFIILLASIVTAATAQTGGTTQGNTAAIFRAAKTGDLEELKQLIGTGTPDVRAEDGATPLFDASMAGQINVMTGCAT